MRQSRREKHIDVIDKRIFEKLMKPLLIKEMDRLKDKVKTMDMNEIINKELDKISLINSGDLKTLHTFWSVLIDVDINPTILEMFYGSRRRPNLDNKEITNLYVRMLELVEEHKSNNLKWYEVEEDLRMDHIVLIELEKMNNNQYNKYWNNQKYDHRIGIEIEIYELVQ